MFKHSVNSQKIFMPVIHFEYTNNLSIEKQVKPFMVEVHRALVSIIKTDLMTCKSAMTCHQDFLIGDGAENNAFIQLNIRMLPGRSKETKDELGHQLMKMIKENFAKEIEAHVTQIRVCLTEIDRDYYYGL